jgi:hypothetical protein
MNQNSSGKRKREITSDRLKEIKKSKGVKGVRIEEKMSS